MGEYFVLMNLRQSIPVIGDKYVDFDNIGGIGCLLVFDSIEALREISPHGKYIKIEACKVTPDNNA